MDWTGPVQRAPGMIRMRTMGMMEMMEMDGNEVDGVDVCSPFGHSSLTAQVPLRQRLTRLGDRFWYRHLGHWPPGGEEGGFSIRQ